MKTDPEDVNRPKKSFKAVVRKRKDVKSRKNYFSEKRRRSVEICRNRWFAGHGTAAGGNSAGCYVERGIVDGAGVSAGVRITGPVSP